MVVVLVCFAIKAFVVHATPHHVPRVKRVPSLLVAVVSSVTSGKMRAMELVCNSQSD